MKSIPGQGASAVSGAISKAKQGKLTRKFRSLLIKVRQKVFRRLSLANTRNLVCPTDLCNTHTHTSAHKNNFLLRDHHLNNLRPNGLIVFSSFHVNIYSNASEHIEFSCAINEENLR